VRVVMSGSLCGECRLGAEATLLACVLNVGYTSF
jgi:hypothetical protein